MKFLKDKEIKKHFKVWNFDSISKGGIPVTFLNKKCYYDDSSDHYLVIGSTGSGKSVSLAIPLIFNLASAGESMVINDTKGELYSYTYQFLKEHGYNIYILNLRDANSSDGWNPLHLPYQFYKSNNLDEAGDMIENFAKSLTKNLSSKDQYWEKSSNAVLSALCYALMEDATSEEEINLYSIYNLLISHGSKYIERQNSLELYFQEKPAKSLSKMAFATGGFAKGETRATLFSVLATTIKMFSDVGIANLTSRTDFELGEIGEKKTAVFLIIPDEKLSRHELASLFIDQCYQALVFQAMKNGGETKIRVNFLLDEFANMPAINGMANKITVSRSRNIRFYLIIQDFAQLKETYKEASSTIKANTNWIYLLTSDNETAKELSTKLGRYTISTSRLSTSGRTNQSDWSLSHDNSLLGRELLMPEELMRFHFGEGIIFKSRIFPIKSTLLPINSYPFYIKKESLPINERNFTIKCFDLDEYRFRNSNNYEDQAEL